MEYSKFIEPPMSKTRPRKFIVYDWIQEETIIYKNHRTYGKCKNCLVDLRADIWKGHPQRCFRKDSSGINLEKNSSQIKQNHNEATSSEIISLVDQILKILLPKFLAQRFPQGIAYQTKSLIVGRVFECCKKLMAQLCCQFGQNLTLQDVQNLIPKNYHINISCVVKEIADLENFPLIYDRVQNLTCSQASKEKFRKGLNAVSKKLNLGWTFSSTSKKQIEQELSFLLKTVEKKRQKSPQMQNPKETTKKIIFYESEAEEAEAQSLSVSRMSIEEASQQQEDSSIICQGKKKVSIFDTLTKKVNQVNNNLSKLIKVEVVKDETLKKYLQVIKSLEAEYTNTGIVDKKMALGLRKRTPFVDYQLLEDLIKKCQVCKFWLDGYPFYVKCKFCCSCYCQQCLANDNQICSCKQPDKLPLQPIQPQEFSLCLQLSRASKLNIYQAENKMELGEIKQFQASLSEVLDRQYQLKYTKISMWYAKTDIDALCSIYDPTLQTAGQNISFIYERYRKGLYLPPVRVSKNSKGYGVYALEDIQSKSFLFEYAADVVSSHQSWGKGNKVMKLSWGPKSTSQMELSALNYCGIGPLLNHSKNPNCKTIRIIIRGIVRVIFYSEEPIRKGSQLTYNYNGFSEEYPTSQFNTPLRSFELEPFQNRQLFNQNIKKLFLKFPVIVCHAPEDILFQMWPRKIINMASISKILNIFTCESLFQSTHLDQSTIIQVPQYLKLFENETQVHLNKGEKLTIQQLFMSMAISSAGDAAQTIAHYFQKILCNNTPTKNLKNYLARMTDTGKKIGMKYLQITDSRGAKDNLCTPSDVMRLIYHFVGKKSLRRYLQMGTSRITTLLNGKKYNRTLVSTNLCFPEKIFGKTGKTREGTANFVGYKYYGDRAVFIGIFQCKEAERWIIVKKILKEYERCILQK